jgi:hypothetical protein
MLDRRQQLGFAFETRPLALVANAPKRSTFRATSCRSLGILPGKSWLGRHD